MDFRDTLSALMPAPRDDEPANLRQDILDELGDHLACAYNRELLRGAVKWHRQRALERFGDPAAVARRLWLDAMKGKIMAQRMLVATCLVVMLACAATVGLAWQWMNQDRLLRNRAAAEAIEVNRRMSEALAQSQAANQQLLTQMREMSEAVLHPVSPDWNQVILKLAEETADGPPAAGYALALTRLEGNIGGPGFGMSVGTDDLLTLSSDSGARRNCGWFFRRASSPKARLASPRAGGGMGGGMGGMGGGMGGFGARHGKDDLSNIGFLGCRRLWRRAAWGLQVSSPQKLGHRLLYAVGQLNVAPGTKVEKIIVCLRTPPERARVRVRWSWPADLEKEQLVVYAPFTFRHRKLEPGLSWTIGDSARSRRADDARIRK